MLSDQFPQFLFHLEHLLRHLALISFVRGSKKGKAAGRCSEKKNGSLLCAEYLSWRSKQMFLFGFQQLLTKTSIVLSSPKYFFPRFEGSQNKCWSIAFSSFEHGKTPRASTSRCIFKFVKRVNITHFKEMFPPIILNQYKIIALQRARFRSGKKKKKSQKTEFNPGFILHFPPFLPLKNSTDRWPEFTPAITIVYVFIVKAVKMRFSTQEFSSRSARCQFKVKKGGHKRVQCIFHLTQP